ncbi:hypothetical protein BHM03_00009581 [Ensete ventricosum]|nr:hypothetical protein BHM03_00009581 [Ensete ventricosum]
MSVEGGRPPHSGSPTAPASSVAGSRIPLESKDLRMMLMVVVVAAVTVTGEWHLDPQCQRRLTTASLPALVAAAQGGGLIMAHVWSPANKAPVSFFLHHHHQYIRTAACGVLPCARLDACHLVLPTRACAEGGIVFIVIGKGNGGWLHTAHIPFPSPLPLAPWLTPGRDVRRHRSWAPRAWGGGGESPPIWTPAPSIVSSSLPLCLPPSAPAVQIFSSFFLEATLLL